MKRLRQTWPALRIVLSKLNRQFPMFLGRLLQCRSFTLERMALNVKRLMICQCREQLTGLHLLAQINSQLLNLVGKHLLGI